MPALSDFCIFCFFVFPIKQTKESHKERQTNNWLRKKKEEEKRNDMFMCIHVADLVYTNSIQKWEKKGKNEKRNWNTKGSYAVIFEDETKELCLHFKMSKQYQMFQRQCCDSWSNKIYLKFIWLLSCIGPNNNNKLKLN